MANASGVLQVRRLIQNCWASMQTEGPPVFAVFEVADREGRRLALKTGAADAIRHEFGILEALSHPAIVSAHQLVEELPPEASEHQLGFTMDLLDGVDFVSWVRADLAAEEDDTPRRNLPMAFGYRMQAEGRSAYRRCSDEGLQRVRTAIPQLASALDALHQMSLAHFDVQPENVICAQTPVLVDFGNAVSLGAELSHLYGLPYYVAPEFAESGLVTEALDAYALGVLLFEAVTGQLPFPADEDPVKVITSKLTLAPPAPSELVDGVPEDLDALIVALLARSAADRPTMRSVGRSTTTK